jgi:hypothetical protein
MTNLETLKRPDLPTVKLEFTQANSLKVSGTITSKEPDKSLGAFFRTVHDAAVSSRLPEVRVDLRGLTFVNSSAIRMFIDWAMWLANEQDHRYRLRVVTSPQVTWQRVSFSTLAHLAGEHLIIERTP